MIPVEPASEPDHFDRLVRQPGLRAIAELVGEPPPKRRRGRKRTPVAKHRDDLKSEHYPTYWRECTDDLLSAYRRICAYACLYIERVTGTATVDHWAPKTMSWDKVYEWDNYRLACGWMNSRKNKYEDAIDPFEVEDGMFALDLVTLKAIPGPKAKTKRRKIIGTIARLGLDSVDYSEALGDYYHDYMEGHIDFAHLEKRAPFLASEMRRQGKLRPGDI
jgi:hypothetical protein